MVVDFIKDEQDKWQMIGIIAYKLDLKRISRINLYYFTLNKEDVVMGDEERAKSNSKIREAVKM